MEKIIIAGDSQKLNGVQKCARFYNLTFNRQLKPTETPDYIERGDLIHKMLKPYYTLRKYRSRWAQNNTTHEQVIKICLRIGEYHAIKMQLDVEEVSSTMFQFTEYCRYYEHDGWDRILAVEQVGSLILYEDDELVIVYEVKPDLVLQLDNGMILPIDHKTAKQRREPALLGNQFMGYCKALNCWNIVINKIGFQKTLKPAERFQRYTLSYPPEVLEEWRHNTVWWFRQLLNFTNEDYWPANFTSCDKYAGCVYQTACVKDGVAREHELVKLFEIAPAWDVGKGL